MCPALLEVLRQQMAVWPLRRPAAGGRNRRRNIHARNRRGQTPERARQYGKFRNEPRLMGVVLEFTDRTPRADAPAIAGVGKMSAGDLSWTFCERYAFHGWPC